MRIPRLVLVSLNALLVACLTSKGFALVKFYSVPMATTKTEPLTLTFPAAAVLGGISVRTQGAENLEFTNATGGTCTRGMYYVAHATCTVMVAFKPRYLGVRYGAVVLLDPTANQNVIATAYMQGSGSGPQVVFPNFNEVALSCGNGIGFSTGITFDGLGDLYASEYDSGVVVKLSGPDQGCPASQVIFNAGGNGLSSAVDGAGNVYITSGSTLFKEAPAPDGAYVQSVVANGFGSVYGVAVDASGNLYVTDRGANGIAPAVIKMTLQPDGLYLQSTIGSNWAQPMGIAIDSAANVYITDHLATTAFKETLSGNTYLQSTIGSGMLFPAGINVAGNSNVYITQDFDFPEDDGSGAIYEEDLQPDGTYAQLTLLNEPASSPEAVATDVQGNVWIADSYRLALYRYDLSDAPPVTVANTIYGRSSQAAVVVLKNVGNAPLRFSQIAFPPDFPASPYSPGTCAANVSLPSHGICQIDFQFKPVAPLSGISPLTLNESIVVTTNNRNEPSSSTTIPVSGTEIAATVETPVVSPPSTSGYAHAPFLVSISDATPGASIYYSTIGVPNTPVTLYTGPFTISGSDAISTYATAPHAINSPTIETGYDFAPWAPKMSPQSGSYSGPKVVTITSATPGAQIYYTLNDKPATNGSTLYTTPITVSKSETINAIAYSNLPGYLPSPNVVQSYVIQ